MSAKKFVICNNEIYIENCKRKAEFEKVVLLQVQEYNNLYKKDLYGDQMTEEEWLKYDSYIKEINDAWRAYGEH